MLNKNEIEALINLLDDPDSNVFDPVVDRLIELGDPAVQALEKRWEKSLRVNHQERIERVIKQIQSSRLKKEIIAWRTSGGKDLLYGAFLVARIQYPELQYEEINKAVEKIRRDIWLELNNELTALEKVKVINYFLYDLLGYDKSTKKTISPQLFLINHLLDTHKGSPVIMGLLYADIAHRLELPVYGVNLPRNFILCYYDEEFTEDPNRIMFYINPYNKGAVLGRGELEYFLDQVNLEPKSFYFTPCSNIDIIERLIFNLKFAFEQARQNDKVSQLNELLDLIKGEF